MKVVLKRLIEVLTYAGVAQLVEHQPSKLRVVGSSLIARSVLPQRKLWYQPM